MASIATEMVPQQQSPPQASMSSLEALIQAAQFLEDSESECASISSYLSVFAARLSCTYLDKILSGMVAVCSFLIAGM